MPKISAGLLMYRIPLPKSIEILLVQVVPIWKKKDDGTWSIPKGGVGPPEDLLAAAIREFNEETGFAPVGLFTSLESLYKKRITGH